MYTAELGWLYGMACLLRLADRTCLLVWASSLASVQMGSGHCVVVSTAQAGNFVSGRLGDLANCCHKGSLFFFNHYCYISYSPFCRRTLCESTSEWENRSVHFVNS